MVVLEVVATGYVVKKIYKKLTRDSEPVNQMQHPGYGSGGVGMQKPYAFQPYMGGNVEVMQCEDARPLSKPYDRNAVYQYFCKASLRQCLAMLVDAVYSRDRGAMDIPLFAPLEGRYIVNEKTEEYTRGFWTRMPEISDEEERKLGLKHYLRIVPNDLPNNDHNKYRLVIALRGTKLTSLRDIVDDIKVAHHTLQCSARYMATQALVERILSTFQEIHRGVPEEVCITGHSLGAAITLLIGKDLAKDKNKRYDVHCFNPPLLSVLMLIQKFTLYDSLVNCLRRLKPLEPLFHAGSITNHLGKLTLAFMLCDRAKLLEEFCHFKSLTDWKPILYVNKGDVICKEYQRFYGWKHRCNLGLPIHMQALVSRIVKRNAKYSCLVPSVDMHINHRDSHCHELKQWYTDPTPHIEFQEYRLLDDANFPQNFNLESVIWKVINDAVFQLAETNQGGHTATRSLPNQTAEYSSYMATSSLFYQSAEYPGYPGTQRLPYQPAEYSASPAAFSFPNQPAECIGFPVTNSLPHQPTADPWHAPSHSVPHQPAMYAGHAPTQTLLYETTKYSGYRTVDLAINNQTALDADSDYDEEISPNSAEEIVLESKIAQPMHDPYMQQGGNMQQTYHYW